MIDFVKAKEVELMIFRNVVGVKRKHIVKYENYHSTDSLKDIIKNQGISRAKLRSFVKDNNTDISFWMEDKNVLNKIK